jgi:hypothetical protein
MIKKGDIIETRNGEKVEILSVAFKEIFGKRENGMLAKWNCDGTYLGRRFPHDLDLKIEDRFTKV